MAYNTPQEAIDDLLGCAYNYDNKPHLLFSCIRRIANQFLLDWPAGRDEIVRIADYAYDHKGRPPKRKLTYL